MQNLNEMLKTTTTTSLRAIVVMEFSNTKWKQNPLCGLCRVLKALGICRPCRVCSEVIINMELTKLLTSTSIEAVGNNSAQPSVLADEANNFKDGQQMAGDEEINNRREEGKA
ncbi:hypothetical protein T11_14004 [Trichinella zimbabwensis]|uniref:Uncharacterized protein n=1 Tax=Trichinella zimbabwensis TaxID=268475 RepID=A0A0V1HSM6_9BILA|nr:hypothetical protein T11_14004 [Trichinella zimbabwensis]